MKITCCCFTCIIGEPETKPAEESHLISEEEDDSLYVKEPKKQHPSPSQASKVQEEAKEDEGAAREKFHRAVGVLKKYNLVSPKYDQVKDKTDAAAVDLKISIKIMARSDSVKIFALDASNVMSALIGKSPDTLTSPVGDKSIVQLRTKVLPLDYRGHSKKYEVSESLTGAMKFMNECLHTLTLVEFQNRSVRFRLYHVFKHQRDILLGEYILDIPSLGLEMESGTTNVIMQLHEPDAPTIKPPTMCDKRRSISSMSGSSGSTQSSFSSNRSYKTTIRRGDVRNIIRKGIPSFSEGEAEPGDRTPPTGLDPVKEDSGSQQIQEKSSSSVFRELHKGFHERTEKVSKLEHATEEMASEAKTFSDMSVRLSDKYRKKLDKKKSTD